MEHLYKTTYLITALNVLSVILIKLFHILKLEWPVYVTTIILGFTFLCLVATYLYGVGKHKNIDHLYFVFLLILFLSIDIAYLNWTFWMSHNVSLVLLISNIVICIGLSVFCYFQRKKEEKNVECKTMFSFVQDSRKNFLISMYVTCICLIAILL